MNNNFTYTENGATQLRTSNNRVLDFFAEVGSARYMVKKNAQVLLDLFANAIAENPKQAMSAMYWVRAVRDGAGERAVFDALFGFAYRNFPKFIEDNLELIGEIGYFKDYVRIFDKIPELEEKIVEIFANGIKSQNHFAAKWLPRRTRLWKLVRAKVGTQNGEFRKLVAKLSDCVEQDICAKKFAEIDYTKVPSKAFNMYRPMFIRHDRERFLQVILNGKINTNAVYPHEVFNLYYETNKFGISKNDVKDIIDAQWENLGNFIAEDMRFITVLDTSGSMKCGADRKAFPLAVYCAENLQGSFNNKVISFSRDARFFDLKSCNGAVEKIELLERNSIVENTNIASVFKLLLDTAVENHIPNSQMPNCLLILSDMQFDCAAEYDITFIDKLKLDYKYAGYDFPALIYWNLEATNTGIMDDEKSNAAFVSGFNPKIMEAVFGGMEYDEIAKSETNSDDAPKTKSLKINPVKVMENALAPIYKKLKFDKLDTLPESFAKYDYNYTRGYSVRLRERKSKLRNAQTKKSLLEALANS